MRKFSFFLVFVFVSFCLMPVSFASVVPFCDPLHSERYIVFEDRATGERGEINLSCDPNARGDVPPSSGTVFVSDMLINVMNIQDLPGGSSVEADLFYDDAVNDSLVSKHISLSLWDEVSVDYSGKELVVTLLERIVRDMRY